MVRNIVILGGNSHPQFTSSVAEFLGVAPAQRVLTKFSSGETRCEIQDSVRGKDVYIIQSFGTESGCGSGSEDGNNGSHQQSFSGVNDFFIELCIMISACKTGSARRVTAVLPLFPYSRQPDLPYAKAGAPLAASGGGGGAGQGRRAGGGSVNGINGNGTGGGSANGSVNGRDYTFESVPATPGPNVPRTDGLGHGVDIAAAVMDNSVAQQTRYTTHDYENPSLAMALQVRSPYKQWMAQAGSLVADLLTCSGADRVVTCDLHESSYQGFFDIPGGLIFFFFFCPRDKSGETVANAGWWCVTVDNLFGRKLLQNYIRHKIENWRDAVIVSPDAGGAKRATAIADNLGMPFALIHKGMYYIITWRAIGFP